VKELTIERLAPDGWPRLRALRLRALADSPDAFGTTLAQDEARPIGDWRMRLEIAENATFLANENGTDIGLVVGTPWEWEKSAQAAGLFAMWVAPEARGAGVGGALVDAVISWARAEGFARVLLDVADSNGPAIRLYESKGFLPTGNTGSLPPPRDHIPEHELELVL
jgi:ribosomal protein S18 acetylase RimI-like enzyme